MKKIFDLISGLILGAFIMIFIISIFLSFATPEKDKFGNYTKFRSYWTSDLYFCTHFDIGGSYCNRLINKIER